MNTPVYLERVRFQQALEKWEADCRQRMALRYPAIQYDSDVWPLKGLALTGATDYSFTAPLADFTAKHASLATAFRCHVAELVLEEKIKAIRVATSGFRALRLAPVESLIDLNSAALRSIEATLLQRARSQPSTAKRALEDLDKLGRALDTLAAKGVVPPLRYTMKHETRTELLTLQASRQKQWWQTKAEMLDRMIEALNEAFNALFANDPRLAPGDRIAIAAMGLELCAPSRINEILCLSVEDHVTIDDYAKRKATRQTDGMHAAHQMLLITMKGSKGAQWSAKPVLNFMIDLFHYCLNVIMAHGERSRSLVRWYEQHPDRLYLPPNLEHLRGKPLTAIDLSSIMALGEYGNDSTLNAADNLIRALGAKRIKVPNPNASTGDRRSSHSAVWAGCWNDIEPLLLDKVHAALERCRKVTRDNHYKGTLTKMLFLFDHEETPYLPGSCKYESLKLRLKKTTRSQRLVREPTLFEKLAITMPVAGVTLFAEINTHDPRRWLTTMALTHGEKFSNVLINKWANRLSIAQLWNYDFRAPETKAASSAMPEPMELAELTAGLTSCRRLEDEHEPTVDIITVHDAGISGTTMDAICAATESRPMARTSEQIIIIYPSWFGFCSHQHHEKPCRAYTPCLPCNNNHVVKGHIPTNDRLRERAEELHISILRVVEQLVIIHGREIADDQEALGKHVSHLAGRGLDPAQMTDELIARFHEIKHLIKDVVLKNLLHEAFVATGYVKNLDNPEVTSGALMKYHNPTHHASPGIERALDAHGGHEMIEQDRQALAERYPQFAPTTLGLRDQRSQLKVDDDDNEVDTDD